MLQYVQLEHLNFRLEKYQREYQTAKPFKHLVLDDLLLPEKTAELHHSFPQETWLGWKDIDHAHQRRKMSCDNSALIPEPICQLIYELNSGPFLLWLGKVAGIENLLPDPYLEGGGLHLTLPGGWLTPHTDFHKGQNSFLYRRLNLLVYLNRDWLPSNQGALELWNKEGDTVEREVLPELGRCVIFQTDDQSIHGFSKPVQERPRCSVAMYYYTAEETNTFSGDANTYWHLKPDSSRSVIDRGRSHVQGALLWLAKGISGLSWRVAKAAQQIHR
jgi:hypothetical protein